MENCERRYVGPSASQDFTIRERMGFQERMLSPRALHFSQHQLFWDCAEISACEALPNGLPLPMDCIAAGDRNWRGKLLDSGSSKWAAVSGVNDQFTETFWKAAVKAYTSCDLTKQSDKRVAIWDIAKLLRDSLSEEPGAGLWENHFAKQLAWRVSDCTTVERPKEIMTNPSWSWTLVKGGVLISDRLQSNRVYTARNHQGKPLAFSLEPEYQIRPGMRRLRSDDIKMNLALMQKELDTIPSLMQKKRNQSSLDIADLNSREEADHPSRDQEPKLASKALKILAHINIGVLHWSEKAAKWTLAVTGGSELNSEDAIHLDSEQ